MKNKAEIPSCDKCKKQYKILDWGRFLQFICPVCLETIFALHSQKTKLELSKFEQAQKRFKEANPNYWKEYNNYWKEYNKHYKRQKSARREKCKI